MEQFDTDDKLIENKDKKQQKTTASQFILIGGLSLIALVLIYFLFKYFKNPDGNKIIDSSK